MQSNGSCARKSALVYSAVVLSIGAVFLWFGASGQPAEAQAGKQADLTPSASFAADAGSLGAIPDSNAGSPTCQNNSTNMRDVTFNATGLTGSVASVSVDFNASHTYLQDLEVTLIAPGGSPSLLLFAATGTTSTTANSCAGSSSDLSTANTYTFADSAAANWWTTASTGIVVPTSTNRTVVSGIGGTTNPPATTSLDTAFGGMSSGQANGTWTLRFRDRGIGDTGSVTAANLHINTAMAPSQHVLDYDGDGKTDFVVGRDLNPPMAQGGEFPAALRFESVRDRLKYESERQAKSSGSGSEGVLAPPPVGSNLAWWISNSSDNSNEGAAFGEPSTDFLVPSDYDGDGKTDIAVWRPISTGQPSENAFFYIFESGSSTLTTVDFGQTNDDPTVTGDYDGDGKADPAVYRCPPSAGADGQCFFYYKGSNNNPSGDITFVPWGFGVEFDFFTNSGDFDGDGKFDFCVQGADPSNPSKGMFFLLRSSDLGVEYVSWGNVDDIIVPGDYDGDGKNDFAISRTESINGVSGRSYYVLERDGGGTGAVPIRWGIAGDIRAPGDYDGDGKTDFAIWRPNSSNADQNFFYILRSSDGALGTFEWGQCPVPGVDCDFPAANWNVH